jgi:addiction module RelE/StbE family toxin
MRVRWTTDAADDLERICDYIAESRPEAAQRVAQSVVERIRTLETFAHLGRPGRVHGTREIAFPPLPFVAVYEVRDEWIIVLRILHGAQRWPQA